MQKIKGRGTGSRTREKGGVRLQCFTSRMSQGGVVGAGRACPPCLSQGSLLYLFTYCLFFEAGSHSVVLAGLKLIETPVSVSVSAS